uniref:Uncharacterized protein n=1 Tax=Tanacetum cinerariifolium TaxID=118510 RepID=A0A699UQB9_TANCI|nr:hypothetical protein [Tanacetum cinerariifolium]
MPLPTAKGKRLKTSAKVDKLANEKQSAKTSKAKGITVLSKEISWKSSEDDDDDDDDDEVKISKHDDDFDDQSDDDDQDDDNDEQTDSDNDDDDFVHPNFSF